MILHYDNIIGDHHNGMSNKLDEVWSVRRNIGVGRNVNSTISQLTANMYSRHGALPAASGHLPPGILSVYYNVCIYECFTVRMTY